MEKVWTHGEMISVQDMFASRMSDEEDKGMPKKF